MKRRLLLLIIIPFFFSLLSCQTKVRSDAIRIACIGDSLTYGMFLPFRAFNSYPSQLQKLLGASYQVKNFGIIGTTLQKEGNNPYWQQAGLTKSDDFAPSVVIIMLGTNDAKTVNWKGEEAFLSDARALVLHYQNLPSRPKVILLTPPTAYSSSYSISEETLDILSKGLVALSEEMHIPFVDIHKMTAEHPQWFFFDGIHTNTFGAKAIATELYQKEFLLTHEEQLPK